MRPGDHVKITRDDELRLRGGSNKGQVGIVRGRSGILQPRIDVEMTSGRTVRVAEKDLRRTIGTGDADFSRRRTWEHAKLLAAFLAAIPILLYAITGGNLSILGIAVLEEIVTTLLAYLFGPYGLIVALVLIGLWLRHRSTST